MGFLFSVLALFSVGEVRNYFIKNTLYYTLIMDFLFFP